ncbi:MAG: hypothetical protein JNM41_06670, partial [Flavipsychrobacter sp.]|nr:hypothetical protein [Flavipsychrobacter sp.]
MLQSSPIITSPTMVALGATKQDSGISGITPFTGNMYGMASLLYYKETEYFELNNDCGQMGG